MKEHFKIERWREKGEILQSVTAVSKQLMRAWDELPAPFFYILDYEHIFFLPTDVPLRRNKFHPTTAGALAYLYNDPEMGAEAPQNGQRKPQETLPGSL